MSLCYCLESQESLRLWTVILGLNFVFFVFSCDQICGFKHGNLLMFFSVEDGPFLVL